MTTINTSKLRTVLFPLLIPLLFIVFVLSIMPVRQAFELDPDEGINLIKALLYSEGFSLYTEIWSDQPPLFTILLSYWLHLFGHSIFAARLLTLLFTALLLWSFCQTLRFYLGNLLAFVGTLLLATSTYFIQLSVSVMIGLPSLSLAMLSIYILILYQQKFQRYLLVISGGLLALSLQIKFFTIFLIPITIICLFDFSKSNSELKEKFNLFSSIILWLCSIVAIHLIISLIFNLTTYDYLFKAPIGQSLESKLKAYRGYTSIIDWLFRRDYNITIFAFFGALVVFVNKRREALFPLVWFVTASLLLLKHQPVWYHHYHLLSIPLCWLAAYGITPAFDFFQQKNLFSSFKSSNLKKLIIPSVLSILFMLSMVRIYTKVVDELPDLALENARQFKIVHLLTEHKKTTRWIFTDRPIYGFYAGLHIPPEIAVFSSKRLVTGNLTYEELVKILQTYRPEQIVLSRFRQAIESNSAVRDYINKNYSRLYEDNLASYYLIEEK